MFNEEFKAPINKWDDLFDLNCPFCNNKLTRYFDFAYAYCRNNIFDHEAKFSAHAIFGGGTIAYLSNVYLADKNKIFVVKHDWVRDNTYKWRYAILSSFEPYSFLEYWDLCDKLPTTIEKIRLKINLRQTFK